MPEASRKPRYDIRNDGIGPYAIFYCETCDREYRSQPEIANTIAKDIGKQTMGGFLRNIPLVGSSIADSVTGEDPRYSLNLTPQQLEKAWGQVKINFRECPTCLRIVCLSDFDEKGGFCNEDSPRRNEIAQAQGEQAGAAIKGLASAFGLGDAFKQVGDAAKRVCYLSSTLSEGRNSGSSRNQVLPRMRHPNGPTSQRCLPKLRYTHKRRKILPGMWNKD